MFAQSKSEKTEDILTLSTVAFETKAITFFIILLICFFCILLLLAMFLYKCYRSQSFEEAMRPLCTGENDDENCLAVNTQMSRPEVNDKVLLHFVNMNMPVRPGILVQRQNKKEMATSLGDIKTEEYRNRQTYEPAISRETKHEGEFAEKIPIHVHRTPTDRSQKRPIKGVTFSKEVIVVDLGNEDATPRSYAREHKERK
ncbi:rCG23283 [Rattus norvegicus]|uniref:RCG23283 n=2 Tax=Rattus norvegicus TaxID=10116 RepID=A6JQ74_RAT|nr:uncharacterized protein C2orf74 homolog [Rattus norvegicus]XP_006251612.1 uncharacterized protein C2orf74 homolog isoform X1 [Rattus norvegicus]EDL97991.1 rCG23283 [Rattus norvegicus]|eukprot:NP_001103052.1 uncharacterized protein C2orf74 homolog [Rattus norvegicus]